MADAKVTSLTEISVPALEDLTYWVDDPAGTPASAKASMTRVMGMLGLLPGGRLTLTTGVPVTTSDVTAAGTLYYTPYLHDKIRIYDGTRWRVYTFTERSLSLTLTSGKNYDVFIYDNAGTLTLELSAAWTTDTARADALTTQDGVTVKSGATTRLWLGTLRAAATNQTEDSVTKRFLWNAYNQNERSLKIVESTASWTYNSSTLRQVRAQTSNRVEVVNGGTGTRIFLQAVMAASDAGNCGVFTTIGVDSTTVSSTDAVGGYIVYHSSASPLACGCSTMNTFVALGYHAYNWLEALATGSATQNMFGKGTNSIQPSGMSGWVMG